MIRVQGIIGRWAFPMVRLVEHLPFRNLSLLSVGAQNDIFDTSFLPRRRDDRPFRSSQRPLF
jgi:hypothetical protein